MHCLFTLGLVCTDNIFLNLFECEYTQFCCTTEMSLLGSKPYSYILRHKLFYLKKTIVACNNFRVIRLLSNTVITIKVLYSFDNCKIAC